MATTYGKAFCSNAGETKDYFLRENYEMLPVFNNKHFDNNMLSRIRNTVVTQFNEVDKIPKMIIMVLDNDIIRYVKQEGIRFLSVNWNTSSVASERN